MKERLSSSDDGAIETGSAGARPPFFDPSDYRNMLDGYFPHLGDREEEVKVAENDASWLRHLGMNWQDIERINRDMGGQ